MGKWCMKGRAAQDVAGKTDRGQIAGSVVGPFKVLGHNSEQFKQLSGMICFALCKEHTGCSVENVLEGEKRGNGRKGEGCDSSLGRR